MEAEYTHGKTVICMWPDFPKQDVDHVVHHIRLSDAEELAEYGTTLEGLDERLYNIVGSTPVSYLVYHDGAPVFMFGLTFALPHVAQLWGFGTSDAHKAIPAVTRYVRRKWLQDVHTGGVRRIEARIPAHSTDSLRWLNSCGMKAECRLAGASVTGNPILQLSYTWDQHGNHQ